MKAEIYHMFWYAIIDVNGKKRYKVCRMYTNGTASDAPFYFKSKETAQNYIDAHNF